MAESDPELIAELEAVVERLQAEYAAIPTIEVKVQPLDQNGDPAGDSYTIASEDGFLNLGYSILTVQEFLLLVQAEQGRAERGFAIDDDWSYGKWGSGRPWPSGTVKYFFDTDTTSGSERDWMRSAMGRMTNGTGIRFEEVDCPEWWLELWHTFFASDELSILTKEQNVTGSATVGKIGQSWLKMDPDYVTDEEHFNHEMGHVFGLLHEHQRHDRDDHVRVGRSGSNYRKIPEREKRYGFLRLWSWVADQSTTFTTPYDYHSIMHYQDSRITLKNRKRWDVHKNETGDVTNNSVWGAENGNTWFTPWDIYTIKRLYGMSTKKPNFIPAPEFPEPEDD